MSMINLHKRHKWIVVTLVCLIIGLMIEGVSRVAVQEKQYWQLVAIDRDATELQKQIKELEASIMPACKRVVINPPQVKRPSRMQQTLPQLKAKEERRQWSE